MVDQTDMLQQFNDVSSAQPPKGLGPDDVLGAYKNEGNAIVDAAAQKGKAEADYTRQEGAYMRGLDQKYEGQYQQTPEFKPTPQSKEDLVALFGVIGALGALGGGKSYGSALGAMNAMGGMLNGYSEGRKELFDREKAEFDKHLQAVQAHNAEISKAFDRAVKMAPYNLSEAKAKLQQTLAGLDAQVLKAQTDRVGITQAAAMWEKSKNQGEQNILRQMQAYRAMEQGLAAQERAKGTSVGGPATLSRLIEQPVGALKDKEASTILGKLYTVKNTLDVVNQARDPDINFGELGRAGNQFKAALQRNLSGLEGQQVSPSEMQGAVENAAREAGLDPTNKNVVFYKNALFQAMAIEREARGGSILPQGMFNRLTPLFDPSKTTRDAFIGIMQGRASDVAQSSGLTPDQIGKALKNLQGQQMPFDTSKTLSPGSAPAAPPSNKPNLQQWLEKAKQANPGASDQELTDYYNKKYGGQ